MFTDIWTVFWRDWIVLKRRLGRYILSRMISPVLYLVAFGWGLGKNIQTGQGSYLDFIVPGIVALNSMNISFNAVGTPLNMSRLYHKTLEEYLIAPIGAAAFVFGKVLSGVLRGLISSAVLIVLAYGFGAQFSVNGAFLLILLINCSLFAALALVAAMSLDSHEDMGNFNTYVLLPMSFLCATFFTPKQLPEPVRWAIELLPLTHASQALRSSAANSPAPAESLIVMLVYLCLFLGIGIWQVKRVRD
ncbi:ABC transporter permease|uniref:Transport permease protein n=1 Tax=Dendrosporobacter quercicolus TaxID=146817 RepID=A0A1G9QYP4_9FIRM|nr:ABC transporter permease [Dendrosporobacter quercicolus]NSL48416.1 ABC transporter permease [Dendrosporobacter quercicolus DSM 1736]SDM16129.1 ABC-type multidrug transport system, permease component [Dendrosporobacter quercicolus]